MVSSPLIRNAGVEDVPLILRFIRAAAEEQAPGAVVAATEESLRKTLHFDDLAEDSASTMRLAWPVLAFTPDEQPAGLLIYLHNYSTWSAAFGVCLEELYVVPEYRRHGYARMLIEAMATAAKAAGCVKMDWVCYSDNDRALRFYDKLGARTMGEWVVLKVDQAGIQTLAADRHLRHNGD